MDSAGARYGLDGGNSLFGNGWRGLAQDELGGFGGKRGETCDGQVFVVEVGVVANDVVGLGWRLLAKWSDSCSSDYMKSRGGGEAILGKGGVRLQIITGVAANVGIATAFGNQMPLLSSYLLHDGQYPRLCVVVTVRSNSLYRTTLVSFGLPKRGDVMIWGEREKERDPPSRPYPGWCRPCRLPSTRRGDPRAPWGQPQLGNSW